MSTNRISKYFTQDEPDKPKGGLSIDARNVLARAVSVYIQRDGGLSWLKDQGAAKLIADDVLIRVSERLEDMDAADDIGVVDNIRKHSQEAVKYLQSILDMLPDDGSRCICLGHCPVHVDGSDESLEEAARWVQHRLFEELEMHMGVEEAASQAEDAYYSCLRDFRQKHEELTSKQN